MNGASDLWWFGDLGHWPGQSRRQRLPRGVSLGYIACTDWQKSLFTICKEVACNGY
jgi:hypothetical protein